MPEQYVGDFILNGLVAARRDWLIVVPSNGLNTVYSAFDQVHRCIFAIREEEAIAVAAGLTTAGKSPAVIMQQTGVGNSLNAVFTLADAYGLYFPILVCDRTSSDPNPVQRVSSQETAKLLEVAGCCQIDWSLPEAPVAFADLVRLRTRWIVCELRGE